ncbi:MAG: hypothetical protein E7388_03025 [Ruminococcaceae bacterium]|nr:hypothetical protein [Oscillospiraceae bacterium]
MCETRFFVCEHCGNLIGLINDAGVPMMCCGQKMTKLEPGTVEASHEKHIPVVTVEGNTVRAFVGEVEHPMSEEHSILWVYLQTDKGGQRKCLSVGSKPVAAFTLVNEKPLAVYAYCNLHGLWKTEIKEEMVCPLQPVDVKSNTNYTVCKCNNVSFFDILDQVSNQGDIDGLLNIFENVKNTTHCSTGCGGCYDKVINIISEAISNGK